MNVNPDVWPKAFLAYSAIYVPVVTMAVLHWGV